MNVRVIIAVPTDPAELIASYVMNWEDRNERRVFAEQANAAIAAGQAVLTAKEHTHDR